MSEHDSIFISRDNESLDNNSIMKEDILNSNVLEIKTENEDKNTGIQNSIPIMEENLVKEEIDIKEEILTYLNDDDNNVTYHTENVAMYNNISNNISIDTLNVCVDIKTENDCKNTSIQNPVIKHQCSVKEENDSFPNVKSSILCSTSEESTSFQNNENNNLSCYTYQVFNKIEQMSPECCDIFKENIYEVKTEIDYKINNFKTSTNDLKNDHVDVNKHDIIQLHRNVINTANNIALESFDVNAVNVLEIKTENEDKNTGMQNVIPIMEENLVKEEIDIKEEILTYLNDDDNNVTYTENVAMYNNISNNISIDTLNVCVDIKTENDCKNTSIQNPVIKHQCSVKEENDSFPNAKSSILCSTSEESTSFQNNENNNLSCYTYQVFNKIEQMSPECCDIFKENIYEVKTEIDYKINNFKTSTNDLKNDHVDVNKHDIIQLQSISNSYKKQYKCDVCQKSFTQLSSLKRHIFTHTGEKPYQCNICSKSFTQQSNFKSHIFTHIGEKPHKCDICHKSFTQKSNLNRHIFTHTNIKPYQCDICQKSFSQKHSLSDHMVIHTDQIQYKCSICRKSFTHQLSLERHILTHTDKKLYKCDICLKSFSRNIILNDHMVTHIGEKPYECDICHKLFTQKSNVKRHIFTHTNKKPFKCDICHKSFSRNSTLNDHMVIHTGEKPYKCNICQKLFTQQSSLKRHIFTHTAKKSYECNICRTLFSRQSSLKKHIFTHTIN